MFLVSESDYNKIHQSTGIPKNNICINPKTDEKITSTLEQELNKILTCKDFNDYDKCKY